VNVPELLCYSTLPNLCHRYNVLHTTPQSASTGSCATNEKQTHTVMFQQDEAQPHQLLEVFSYPNKTFHDNWHGHVATTA
jgi:hypothetical protein